MAEWSIAAVLRSEAQRAERSPERKNAISKRVKRRENRCRYNYCYLIGIYIAFYGGEMAEWLKAAVLKTVIPFRDRGFESLSLRQFGNVAIEQ